jgi:hypothetical protein
LDCATFADGLSAYRSQLFEKVTFSTIAGTDTFMTPLHLYDTFTPLL